MNKTIKRNVVVSAILAIMLCVSLIAGTTFALFTSESKVNIAVTSGKVDVVASLDEASLTLYSPTSIDYDTHEIKDANNAATETFKNGGTATIDGNTLTLTNVTPGDKATVKVIVTNNSNVTIQYRTIIACESDNGLFSGLNVTIAGEKYEGETKVSKWATIVPDDNPVAEFEVVVELPSTAGNEYQEKTMTLSYQVEAVQGNAATEDPDPSIYYIYTANDLVALRNIDLTQQSKIVLVNNINMSGIKYEPWNMIIPSDVSVEFDGNNKTISNLTVVGNHVEGVGFENAALFAGVGATHNNKTQSFTVSNLTIDNAKVSNSDGTSATAAAIIGATQFVNTKISNCTVKNSTLTSTAFAAAFIGYGAQHDEDITTEISGCTVNNCKISGNDATGALVALSNFAVTVSGKTTVTNNTINGGDGYSAAALVGSSFNSFEATNVTLENNTFAMNEGNTNYVGDHKDIGYFFNNFNYVVNGIPYTTSLEQFSAAVNGSYEKVVLAADITNETLHTGTSFAKYVITNKNLTIDLAGHTFATTVDVFYVNGADASLSLESSKTNGKVLLNKTYDATNKMNNGRGISVDNGGTLNIGNNVVLETNVFVESVVKAIGVQSNIYMNGGEIIVYNSNAVYLMSGNFTMNGGTITLKSAIEGGYARALLIQLGTATLNSGTVEGTGYLYKINYFGNDPVKEEGFIVNVSLGEKES